jgi:hypothetical protein
MKPPYTLRHDNAMFIDKHIKNNSNKHSINSLKGVLKKKIPPIVFTEDLDVKIDEERAKQIGIMLKENTIEKCRHRMLSRSVDIEDSDKNTLNSIRLQSKLSMCDKCNNVMFFGVPHGQVTSELSSLKDNLAPILKELEIISSKTKQDLDDKFKSLNWKFAAMVIDRLCLILFAFATFVTTFMFTINIFYDFE